MSDPRTAPRPWRSELRALLALGLPMALTQALQLSINTVDVLMIARLGPEALAAAAMGFVVFYFIFMLALGPATALSPLFSQSLGANADNVDDVRANLRMGLYFAALLLPCAVALSFGARDAIIALGQSPHLAARAAPYVIALAPSLPFMIAVIMLRNFLAVLERTRFPLLVIAGATVLHAF